MAVVSGFAACTQDNAAYIAVGDINFNFPGNDIHYRLPRHHILPRDWLSPPQE